MPLTDTFFEVITADITTLAVDAIVNAANESLLGGGGVDGAIHRAAGPELRRFCEGLKGCRTGQAKLSPGFRLPARAVIHTVGPVWNGGHAGEAQLLAGCYRACLEIAAAERFDTVAFPAISTGIYAYPLDQATTIAIETCASVLENAQFPRRVQFVCFSAEAEQVYRTALASHGPRK